MSLHAQLSPEVIARLQTQQRNNTVMSIVIAVLMLTLVGIILFWILLPAVSKPTTDIVSYIPQTDNVVDEVSDDLTRPTEVTPVEQSSASSVAKVIASSGDSSFSIPVTNDFVSVESPEFGADPGLGDSWGEFDSGAGSAGAAATFFGSEVTGNRILYVIDYSLSMRNRRETLMREELVDSVKKLSGNHKYQILMFAGPAWIAGDKVVMSDNKRVTRVTSPKGKVYNWESKRGGASASSSIKGSYPKPTWLQASSSNIKASVGHIKGQELILGTKWANPLEMAFKMDPLPNAIIFMTDGLGGSTKIAESYAKKAIKKNITISTLALMEPKAKEAMLALSQDTGGSFSLIGEDGKRVGEPVKQ